MPVTIKRKDQFKHEQKADGTWATYQRVTRKKGKNYEEWWVLISVSDEEPANTTTENSRKSHLNKTRITLLTRSKVETLLEWGVKPRNIATVLQIDIKAVYRIRTRFLQKLL